MTSFEIIPAIDLRAGRCVRLLQGDFARETIYGDDLVAMGRRWERLGAQRLHIVDLDGARAGHPVQLNLIEQLIAAVDIPIELGGGLRRIEHVEAALAAGVERVVLGTAAINDGTPNEASMFRQTCLDRFGLRVVIGLDARDGMLAVRGWTRTTAVDAFEFAERLVQEGFQRIVYTDISRDGALKGPNMAYVHRLAGIPGLKVIASGGIGSIDDLVALHRAGAEAAITGQALYTGAINLPIALDRLAADSAEHE